MQHKRQPFDDALARLDPGARIDELERQVRTLRAELQRSTYGLAAWELVLAVREKVAARDRLEQELRDLRDGWSEGGQQP